MHGFVGRELSGRASNRAPRRHLAPAAVFAAALALACAGCSRLKPVNTAPLESAGMSYPAIQQLTALKITASEVAQMAKARQAGFSDADCVSMLKLYRADHHPFDAGDAVAGLAQVGMSDAGILRLAKIRQLGLGWGELQAMKLAGMSDAIVMAVAERHAGGKPVLSGASLARLKNAGVRESTLLKLVQSGVPDSDARAILAYRRRGASGSEILRHFARL